MTTTVTSTVTIPITTVTSTMTFPTTTATSTMTIPTTTTGRKYSEYLCLLTSICMISVMTTSTSSGGTCTLNCQNGGIPETVDGCFCYCLDNTYGRECENSKMEFFFFSSRLQCLFLVNCAAPDIDSSICTSENQPLCVESENFALECHHLCGKC